MNYKHILSYWVKEHPCGIIQLLFNTKDKWIDFERLDDNTYGFGNPELTDDVERVFVPNFLKKDISYLPLEFQEKDQISFYYIPLDLIGRNGKIIIQSEN